MPAVVPGFSFSDFIGSLVYGVHIVMGRRRLQKLADNLIFSDSSFTNVMHVVRFKDDRLLHPFVETLPEWTN